MADSTFDSLRISAIVIFDFGCILDGRDKRFKLMEELRNFYQGSVVKEDEYDDSIYDCEFIESKREKKPIKVSGIQKDNIVYDFKYSGGKSEDSAEYFSLAGFSYTLIFDYYGIGTLRVDVPINRRVDILTIFNLEDDIGSFIDSHLYPKVFKHEIETCLKKVYGVSKVLKEHRTHSIIITNDISDSKPFDRECYGLIWRDRDYKNTRYEVIKENVKNLAILPDSKFMIGYALTFMGFSQKKLFGSYVAAHVKAIETLRRQEFLLKKFDYELSYAIEHESGIKDLKKRLEKIEEMQKNVFLLTDFYEKAKPLALAQFIHIFDYGRKVFGMNELYDSVQHRLDISYKLVSDTIQERRNEIIKVATFIGLVFASVAVVEFLVNNLLLNYVYNQQWWWLASIKAFIGGNWKGVFNMFVWAVLLLLGIFFWWKAK